MYLIVDHDYEAAPRVMLLELIRGQTPSGICPSIITLTQVMYGHSYGPFFPGTNKMHFFPQCYCHLTRALRVRTVAGTMRGGYQVGSDIYESILEGVKGDGLSGL